ncbi:hypothetical protein BH11MYX1_BH11MYX1_09620 [soil metagenome]
MIALFLIAAVVVAAKLATTGKRRPGRRTTWTSSDTLPMIYGDSAGESHHAHDAHHHVGHHHVDGSHH